MEKTNADKESALNIDKEEIADSFFFQIHRMKRAIFRRTNALMTEAGITLQLEQLPLLMILRHSGFSQRELSDKTMRDKSSILRSITALEKKNLVGVAKDKTDKRKNIVSLTEEGFAMAKEIRSLMKRAEDEVMSVFSPKERIEALNVVKSYADKLETL
ncbi:MarR family transcriptional regulator [Flavobacterium sp. YJ01]|uniref:MarR family winged helix-turn-helix transcriptional regulator n=1 Tax=unclassified Flavobacterium TaxID=196869 RepID=UPI0023E36A5A|nr:MarR family transcriptional regulator [Flavobacterium sp. YJ01]WET01829.1 winged helix DNA-binding protein [Flavobacterium sp. YJ01]